MNELIQEIHERFEVSVLEMSDNLSTAEKVVSYIPKGMTPKEFIEKAEYYSQHYPLNAFVTEAQVKEICLQYRLVMGPRMLFTADIPRRNQKQIESFSLRKRDETYSGFNLINFFMEKQKQVEVNFSERSNGQTKFFLDSMVPADFTKINEVLPVGEGFILIAEKGNRESLQLYCKINVYDSEWTVKCGKLYRETGDFEITLTSRRVGDFVPWVMTIQQFVQTRLRLTESDFEPLRKMNLNDNVNQMVVAPDTMFNAYKDAVEIKDGYRLRFKDVPMAAPGFFNFVFPDPIVLQPVPGGYLVVTKWGAESGLITNERQN